MEYEKYLPLGTVIKKSNDEEIMIIGYSAKMKKDSKEYYDYVGVPYPMGIITSGNCLAFNHNEITQVIWFGYVSEYQKKFNIELNRITNRIKEMEDENNEQRKIFTNR